MWEDIIGKKERGAEKKLKKVAGNEQEYIILALRFFFEKNNVGFEVFSHGKGSWGKLALSSPVLWSGKVLWRVPPTVLYIHLPVFCACLCQMDVDSTSAEKDHSCPCWGILWPSFCASFCFFFGCTKQQILCFSGCFPAIFLAVYLQGGEPKPHPTEFCPEVSTALDLSPIPEDREKAAEAPRGDWEIVEGVVFLGGREIAMRGWWG